MSKEMQTEDLTRREALRWAARRVGEAAVIGLGLMVYSNLEKNSPVAEAVPQYQTPPLKEAPALLSVKDFAADIVFVSSNIFDFNPDQSVSDLLAGFLVGNLLLGSPTMGSLTADDKNRVLDKKIASMSAIPARTLDSLSTMMFASQMEDPRFKEYGLNEYFREQNMLSPRNPSIEDFHKRNLVTLPIVVAASWAGPAIGRGYLGASPFIARHNLIFASVISKSLSLGDNVKDLVSKGENRVEIERFLGKALADAEVTSGKANVED